MAPSVAPPLAGAVTAPLPGALDDAPGLDPAALPDVVEPPGFGDVLAQPGLAVAVGLFFGVAVGLALVAGDAVELGDALSLFESDGSGDGVLDELAEPVADAELAGLPGVQLAAGVTNGTALAGVAPPVTCPPTAEL